MLIFDEHSFWLTVHTYVKFQLLHSTLLLQPIKIEKVSTKSTTGAYFLCTRTDLIQGAINP